MKQVSLVIYNDAFLTAVATTLDLLTTANQLMKKAGNQPVFEIHLVSENPERIRLELPAQFVSECSFTTVQSTDIIIVPAFKGNRDPLMVLKKNAPLINWLKNMHRSGSEIVSLCYACYFLAEAGLLDGKSCTSHWMAINGLKSRYPKLNILPDAVVTDEDGVCTGGGGFSSLNVLSYLIEKHCGREITIQISKLFSIDIDRHSQAHFSVFQGQHQHGDEAILSAQNYMEKNFEESITIDQVAQTTPMSKRSFIRRFKKATHYTPLEYLQRVKIEAAKRSFEEKCQDINQVMYAVGYTDAKNFRLLFKRFTGLSPLEYRSRYHQKVVI